MVTDQGKDCGTPPGEYAEQKGENYCFIIENYSFTRLLLKIGNAERFILKTANYFKDCQLSCF